MKINLTDEDNKNLQEIVDSINVTIKDDLQQINLDCYVNSILFEDNETILTLALDGEETSDVRLSILRSEIWQKIFTIFIRDLKLKLIYTE